MKSPMNIPMNIPMGIVGMTLRSLLLAGAGVGMVSLVSRLSCVGREKTAWYTLFAHAQFSQDFSGNLEISRKTCVVTLTSARHTDFSRIKDAATDYALCGR